MASPQTVVELCQALIRIPSVNPAGNPGTEHVGEAACAEFIRDFLRDSGFPAELREVLPGRPNVVARCSPRADGKPRLLLAPHTDTVSVAGMKIAPFGGELRDGRIWGRGASDTKGPMAAMLWALKENASRLDQCSHEVWFAGLAGEEAGQQGAHALAAEERFDFVIAGEPTGLGVVHTHKGSVRLELITHGVAAHSARPELGQNAIYLMMDVLQALREEIAPTLQSSADPILGKATFSVGIIQGGSKTNIVPDRCTASVDIRTIPSQRAEQLVTDITEKLQKLAPTLEVRDTHSAPLFTPPDHPVIAQLKTLGATPTGAPWFCDAAVFGSRGTPAIALGPGSIAQAHTDDEWITIADLEAGAAFFSRFLTQL